MEIIIHRGKDQIGGNIIEITTQKTRILLDAGRELDEEEVHRGRRKGRAGDAQF